MSNKIKLAPLEGIPNREYVYFSLVLMIVSGLIFVIIRSFLPPVVPFFYGSPIGEKQLVPQMGLLLAPLLSLVITVFNLFLASKMQDKFVKQVLIAGSVLFSLFMAIAFVKVVFLVGLF